METGVVQCLLDEHASFSFMKIDAIQRIYFKTQSNEGIMFSFIKIDAVPYVKMRLGLNLIRSVLKKN